MSEAFAALSIIDLSNFKDADKESRLQVSSQLVEACHTVGFCYIAGHGIPQTDLDTAFAWNRKFHSLPAASKEPARRPESSNSFLGWHDIGKLTLHPSKPDSTVSSTIPDDNPTTPSPPFLVLLTRPQVTIQLRQRLRPLRPQPMAARIFHPRFPHLVADFLQPVLFRNRHCSTCARARSRPRRGNLYRCPRLEGTAGRAQVLPACINRRFEKR